MTIATPLSVAGRFIVDASGRRVRLAGVNWSGAHQDLGVAAGLEIVDRREIAETIAGLGFNSVRFPFSVWMTEQTAPVPKQYIAANPDLYGSTPMEVYDACVAALTDAGLIVIPNCHMLYGGWCCSEDDNNGLWFNDNWPAERFMTAWKSIATRYAANPLVAAMDIANEPRRATVGGKRVSPLWGSGSETDFALMYTTVGNLIHEIDPDPLIICEGLNYAADLSGVARNPVRLDRAGKAMYSLHDYPWFHPAHQGRESFFRQMHSAGGYILANQIAPLWVGEFGNDMRSSANFGLEPSSGDAGGWWNNFHAWLTDSDADWCWWPINGTHTKGTTPVTNQIQHSWGDREVYGILAEDWTTIANPAVLEVLQSLIHPRTGPGIGC